MGINEVRSAISVPALHEHSSTDQDKRGSIHLMKQCQRRTTGQLMLARERTNSMFRKNKEPHVQVSQPAMFSQQNIDGIARVTLTAMLAEQAAMNHSVTTFQDGVNTAIKTLNSNVSQQTTKTFTDIQKGKIMGLCSVTR